MASVTPWSSQPDASPPGQCAAIRVPPQKTAIDAAVSPTVNSQPRSAQRPCSACPMPKPMRALAIPPPMCSPGQIPPRASNSRSSALNWRRVSAKAPSAIAGGSRDVPWDDDHGTHPGRSMVRDANRDKRRGLSERSLARWLACWLARSLRWRCAVAEHSGAPPHIERTTPCDELRHLATPSSEPGSSQIGDPVLSSLF
jgi:hypothetical protein